MKESRDQITVGQGVRDSVRALSLTFITHSSPTRTAKTNGANARSRAGLSMIRRATNFQINIAANISSPIFVAAGFTSSTLRITGSQPSLQASRSLWTCRSHQTEASIIWQCAKAPSFVFNIQPILTTQEERPTIRSEKLGRKECGR